MTRPKSTPPKKAAAGKKAPGKKPVPAAKKAPEPAPPETGKAGGKPVAKALARKRTPQVARETLAVELRRIRSLFVEIAERYVADTEGRIVSLVDELDRRKLPAPCVDRLLEKVRDLRVKPRKGRRKDLARIESLVDAIVKTLED
jgi:hypothetical protein